MSSFHGMPAYEINLQHIWSIHYYHAGCDSANGVQTQTSSDIFIFCFLAVVIHTTH